MNETLLKGYEYFKNLMNDNSNLIKNERIIKNEKMIEIDNINSDFSYWIQDKVEDKKYYWNSIIYFRSIRNIYRHIKFILKENNLFKWNNMAEFILLQNTNNKQEPSISYPADKEKRKIYTVVSNKILSIIVRPFTNKVMDLKNKINLLINLEQIFIEEKKEKKFYEILDNIIQKNYYQIESLIHLLELRNFSREIRNSNNKSNASISDMLYLFCSNDFYKIIYDEPSNFILVITNIFLNNYSDIDMDKFISHVNDYFNYDIDEYKFDIYKLINDGKQKIDNWLLLNKHLDKQSIKAFWSNNTLTDFFSRDYCSHNQMKKYETLFLIYIGYGLSKNYFNLIDKKLSEIMNIDKNADKNYFKLKKISKHKIWILNKIISNINDIKSNKWIEDNSFVYKNNYIDEINKEFNNKHLEWFQKIFKKYADENKLNNREINFNNLNEYWKILIITIYDNKENLVVGWEKVFIYWLLTSIDISISLPITGISFGTLPKEKIQEIEDKLYLKSSYDEKIARKRIFNLYGRYVENLDNIHNIVLVDNSMLSIVDKYRFTSYEFMGDIIYKIIINDLKINCIIEYDDKFDIFSHTVQEEICKSMHFEKYIQKDEDIYYDGKKISNADYFEVFLYFLYKNNGYKKTKDVVIDLITKNYKQLLIKKDKWNWINEENIYLKENWIKNNKLTILEPIYCTLKRYNGISHINNKINQINEKNFHDFAKIMKVIFKSWIKLLMAEGKYKQNNLSSTINLNDQKIIISFSHWLDDELKVIVQNFENEYEDMFYYNLYNEYNDNFNKFEKYVKVLINVRKNED